MEVRDILAPLDLELKKVSMLGGTMSLVVVPLELADSAVRAKRETDTAVRCADYLVIGMFGMGSDDAATMFLSVPKGIAAFPLDGRDVQTLFFEAVKRLNTNSGGAPWVKDLWDSIKGLSVLDADRDDRFLKGSFYQFSAYMAENPLEMGRVVSAMSPSDRRWVEDMLPVGVVSSFRRRPEEGDREPDGDTSLIERWNYKEKLAAKVELGRSTLRRFRSIEQLFTLPSISQEILEAASDPMSAASRMARIIEKDPVLTSRVLKVVNSAFYGFRRQIVSVEHAVVILGNDEVVNLAFSIAVHQILDRISSRHGSALWEHSLMVAHLAQWIGLQLGCASTNELYTIGLLHDFGKIVFIQKGFVLHGLMGLSNIHELAAEEGEMGLSHAEMGAYVAERWNLPEEIVDALLHHHLPGKARDMALSASVHMADALAHTGVIPYDEINSAAMRLFEPDRHPGLAEEIVAKRYDYTLKRVKTLLDI